MIVHKSECNVVDAELEQHHAGLATPRLVPGAAEQRGDRRTLHGMMAQFWFLEGMSDAATHYSYMVSQKHRRLSVLQLWSTLCEDTR